MTFQRRFGEGEKAKFDIKKKKVERRRRRLDEWWISSDKPNLARVNFLEPQKPNLIFS